MIQRIQTVYLILALAFCGIIFFIPLSLALPDTDAGNVYKLDAFGISYSQDQQTILAENTIALTAALAVASLLILIIIFMFKNRSLQIKLGRMTTVLLLVFVVLIFYYTDYMVGLNEVETKSVYVTGTYFPFIIIMLLLLAVRAIKKDDALVKSADRLR